MFSQFAKAVLVLWMAAPQQGFAEVAKPLPEAHAELNDGHRWIIAQFVEAPPLKQSKFALNGIVMLKFYAFTGGVRTLDEATWQEQARRADAEARGTFIANFLAGDLDNNGVVTSMELERRYRPDAVNPDRRYAAMFYYSPTDEEAGRELRRMVSDALQHDRNRDGAVDFAEMRIAAQGWRERQRLKPDNITPIMQLDENADKAVSEDELQAAVDRVFDLVDENKDLVVDAMEVCVARHRYVEPPIGDLIRSCF